MIFLNLIQKIDNSRFPGVIYILISSILTSFSFAPWRLWPLGFLCLIPIFYYIENADIKKRPILKIAGLGALQGILVSSFAYHWVVHTMMDFGHLPLAASLPIFLLYAVGTNLRWVFFFLLLYWFKKNRSKLDTSQKPILRFISHPYFFCTGLWGIAEYFGWQLFPYYGINLVSGNLIFVQIVDVLGIYGASLIWFLINYSLYKAFTERKIPKTALGILIVCHIYGTLAYFHWNSEQKSYKKVNIGVTQGHTPLGLKRGQRLRDVANSYLNRMILQSYEIVREAESQNKTLDMIVWPESSAPYIGYYFFDNFKKRLDDFQENNKIELFINDLLTRRDHQQRKNHTYSNVFLLGKNGEVLENYQKVALLPFGEFLPLGDIFPSIKRVFVEVSDFTRGEKFSLFPSEIGKVMPLICYEVILPDFVFDFHEATQKKAQIMINVTNDTWFGESIESSQHLELARLRAIELRLPLVRGVNSGISTWFDITGRNFGETELFTKANRIYTVPIPKEQSTIYSLFGNWLHYIFMLVFALGGLVYFWLIKLSVSK